MKIINFEEYINETQKKSSLTQPTDEEIQDAEKYLAEGIDPDWDQSKFGFFYIDVSGRYSVYYTLWRFKPSVRNSYTFITNLSTNFKTAVEKAKKAAGRVPVIIDKYGTNAGLFRTAKSELITFGKYRGKNLGDIFVEDPKYIVWLANNYDGKSAERAERLKYYKDLYFETITKKNIEESKSQFIGKIGDKITIEAKIYSAEKFVGSEFSRGSQQDFHYKCKLIDDNGNKYLTYNIGTNKEAKVGDRVKLSGKIANHKETLGIKFTVLNYCKLLWSFAEDIEKYNL